MLTVESSVHVRLYLTPRFAAALDEHVRTEFPRLRDHLHGVTAA